MIDLENPENIERIQAYVASALGIFEAKSAKHPERAPDVTIETYFGKSVAAQAADWRAQVWEG